MLNKLDRYLKICLSFAFLIGIEASHLNAETENTVENFNDAKNKGSSHHDKLLNGVKGLKTGAKIMRKIAQADSRVRQYKKYRQKQDMEENFKINVQEFITDSGIKVRFVKNEDSKIVFCNCFFENVGEAFEEKKGLYDLYISILNSSDTEKHSDKEILKLCRINGIHFFFFSGFKDLGLSASFLIDKIDLVSDLIQEYLFLSKLNQFEKSKLQLISSYKDCCKSPDFLIGKNANRALFGNHKYASMMATDKDLEAITEEDILNTSKTKFFRDNLKVVVVGNLTEGEVRKFVDETFGKLPLSKEKGIDLSSRKIEYLKPNNFGELKLKKEKFTTNRLQFYLVDAPKFDSDDYIPIQIALRQFSQIPLQNTLINNLRKKLGKVYYARFGHCMRIFSDLFVGSTESSDYEKVKKAIHDIIDDFGKNGISEKEFNEAKRYIISQRAFDKISGSAIANRVFDAWKLGLDANYVNDMYKKMEKYSLETVNAVIKKYFTTENLSIVVLMKDDSCDLNQ